MSNNETKLADLMAEFGVDETRAKIMIERQKVYGDPLENHMNIAHMFSIILRPWSVHLLTGKCLPPHVVALCMCSLKLTRERLIFHRDNYDDMNNYQQFAATWHEMWERGQIGDGAKPWALIPAELVDLAMKLENERK